MNIKNEKEYNAIMQRIDELVEIIDDNTSINDRHCVELDFLADLVVDYEKEHFHLGKPTVAQTPHFQHEYAFA